MITLSTVLARKLRTGITLAAALALIISPLGAGLSAFVAHAAGESVSIGAVSPSNSVATGTPVSFTATASGQDPADTIVYSVDDAFSGSTVVAGDIDPSTGEFNWTPTDADAAAGGVHHITVTATDTTDSTSATGSTDITVTDSTVSGGGSSSNTITVGPSGNYSTIQEAIDNAASGDTISVAAGTYEGFKVDGASDLTITGAGDSTMIIPTTLIDSGIGHKYTASHATASVFVNDSTDVRVQDMDIESGSNTPDAIVFWNGSTGTIDNATVKGTYTISGSQTGQGIAVDGSASDSIHTDLTVQDTEISGFQKNGIDIVDGNGTAANGGTITVAVKNGSITGAGTSSVIAQNGIVAWNQGGGDVSATVNGTSISDMRYSDTASAADTAILVYGTAAVSSISNVDFSNVDLYIDNEPGSSAIDATSGNTFDGVSPSDASGDQLATIEDMIGDVMSDNTNEPVYLLPNTLIVTQNNLGIQAGVDAAASGDTIRVTPGTYASPITITKSDITVAGGAGVTIHESATDTFGYPVTVDNASDVTISDFSFDAAALGANSYALHAYKADGLTLNGLSFTGPGKTSTHIGGVDVNTSNDVTISDVTANGFYKNGFAFTAQYDSTDSAADGITLNGVAAENNGYAGIAFYTVVNDHSPATIGGSASFSDVHFTGTNTVSGNTKGVQVQGDSDANASGSTTPANSVTSDGTTLDLSHIDFSGNTVYDIVNYQTAPTNAVGATFAGKTGFDMSGEERASEDAKILDQKDNAALGLVTYIETVTTHGGGSSGQGGSGSGSGSNGTVTTTTGTTGTGGEVLGAATFNFTSEMTIGATGNEVTELQKVLIAGGYLHIDAPTGYFGALTQAAVKAFQAAHNIPATGYVGPLTLAALNMGGVPAGLSDTQRAALLVALADILKQVLAIQAKLDAMK